MKTKVLKNRIALLALLMIGASTLLTSCLKDRDDFSPAVSHLAVVNGQSGQPSVDLFFNRQRVNNSPILYKSTLPYLDIYSGRVTITKGSTTQILLDGGINFTKDKYYTLFVSRKFADNADSTDFVFTEDNLTPPTSGKAKIRFVNLTPGTRRMDVYVGETQDTLFSDKSPKTSSAYKEIVPGVISLKIRESDSTAVKLPVSITLEAGKIYTLMTTGLWEGTTANEVFGTQLLTDK